MNREKIDYQKYLDRTINKFDQIVASYPLRENNELRTRAFDVKQAFADLKSKYLSQLSNTKDKDWRN